MFVAPFAPVKLAASSRAHGVGADPHSKFQARQPAHAGAPSVHWQLPELQTWFVAHTLVHEPQWLLSFSLTLMHPLVPQSVVGAGQLHVPLEQVFPPPQLVPSVLLDQAEVLVAGLQIWQAFDALVAPLPTRAPAIQQPLWQVPLLHTCPVPQLAPLAPAVHAVSA
jgi:hypothetical protein